MSNESWRKPFNEAAAMGIKVAVCDERARMLACANCGHTAASGDRLMGEGWHDFLQPEELPAILEWFADRYDNRPISYQQLSKIDGKPAMTDITLMKYWHGSAYLCFGAVRAHPQPAQPRRRAQQD